MVLVRGHDAYSAVTIGEETSWGSEAGGTFYRVPILSESLTLERDQFPKSREFGTTGAVEFQEAGRSVVRGGITVHPRYDAPWFYILVAQAFGSEVVIADEWLDGGGMTAGEANTHGFTFATTIPEGLTIRVYKSGPNTSGYTDTFLGCKINRMIWDQPEDDIARVTFEFVGKSVSTGGTGSEPAPGTAGGSEFLKARDLSNTGARLKTGATLQNDFNIRSFRLTLDKRIEEEPSFLQTPDTIEEPGVIDTRDITLELNGQLEQAYGATSAERPWEEFLNKTESQCDIRYCSTSVVSGSDPYGIRLHMPAIVWEEVNGNLGEPGANPFTARARAIQGTVASQAGTDEAASTVLSTGATTDLRCFAAVDDADDSDTEFSSL